MADNFLVFLLFLRM